MKKVKFFVKDKKVAKSIYEEAKNIFSSMGIKEVEHGYDIAIAIGGDGTFLKMISSNNYDTNIKYAGISAGTLGFLEEINKKDIKSLAEAIINENYSVKERLIEEIDIDGVKEHALNEVVIRNSDLSVIGIKIDIDNNMFENVEGDGIIICTPTGSSAYNLSLGGAIVYENLECLEITPIAPLNTKAYRALKNSLIVPKNINTILSIHDIENKLLITLDGQNKVYKNVKKISVMVSDKKISCIYLNKINYIDILNDKLLG